MKAFVLTLIFSIVFCDEITRKPLYKYRYETEDVMKTAASSVPVHGYHIIEGGYYPSEISGAGGYSSGGYSGGFGSGVGGGFVGSGGYGGKLSSGGIGGIGGGISHGIGSIGIGSSVGGLSSGGLGGIGGGRIGGIGAGGIGGIGAGGIGGIGAGGIGYGGGIGGQFIGSSIHHPHSYGGEEIDKSVYKGEKKNINDESYEKASGKKGEEINQGQQGYSQGQVAVKEGKGDNGYFSDVEGGKKVIEDGKSYHGAQQFNQEGKSGEEKKNKSGHKKGHKIKGFKTSHHKDESGKTEEFYDEANDEGDNYNFNGQAGSFGENGGTAYKGGHEDGKFNKGESKKEGHYVNEHIVDKNNADHGKYGENKFAGNGVVYGKNNGFDQESLLGHQENNRFYKHFPHHAPFYHHY